MSEFYLLIAIVLGGVILIKALRALGSNKKPAAEPSIFRHYQLETAFLSKAERAFYQVLTEQFGETHLISAKLRIADFISVDKSSPGLAKNQAFGLFQRISSKHCDFLIADKEAGPLVWIELDDSSHNTKAAKKNDTFKNELAAAVGIALLRVQVRDDFREAMKRVERALALG